LSRILLYCAPVVPTVALLVAIWLPFVNTARYLWFGMPPLFVWLSFWVLMITPTLVIAERARRSGEALR